MSLAWKNSSMVEHMLSMPKECPQLNPKHCPLSGNYIFLETLRNILTTFQIFDVLSIYHELNQTKPRNHL
jgi:hypothetical protein